MPSPQVMCEFCGVSMRKDAYGTHVQAKHKKEIAQMMLEEYIVSQGSDGCIKQYAQSQEVCIYSKAHKGAEYMFGATAHFILTEDSFPKGFSSAIVRKNHLEVVEECINLIPLTDFLKANVQMTYTSPAMWKLKHQNAMLLGQVDMLLKQKEKLEDSLNNTVHSFKDAVPKEHFQRLCKENKEMTGEMNRLRQELDEAQNAPRQREEAMRKQHLDEVSYYVNKLEKEGIRVQQAEAEEKKKQEAVTRQDELFALKQREQQAKEDRKKQIRAEREIEKHEKKLKALQEKTDYEAYLLKKNRSRLKNAKDTESDSDE